MRLLPQSPVLRFFRGQRLDLGIREIHHGAGLTREGSERTGEWAVFRICGRPDAGDGVVTRFGLQDLVYVQHFSYEINIILRPVEVRHVTL